MSRPRRPDTLFGRLMLAQALLALISLVIGWCWNAIARDAELAPMQVRGWTPRIQQALTSTQGGLAAELAVRHNMARATERPAHLWFPATWVPFWKALQQDLARQQVVAGDPYLAWRHGEPVLWFQVSSQDPPAPWLSLSLAQVLPPATPRIVTMSLATLLVVTLASLYYVRRITHPIQRLRRHMHAHAQSGGPGHGASPPEVPADAPVEIRAIFADYGRLLAQLQHHEHERALLLAGVSHDLRSPLGRIRLAAELLPETPPNQDGVQAITRNVELADRLVGSFLDFVRVATLQLDEAVDLAAVVQQAVAGFGRPPEELRWLGPDALPLPQANALLIDRLVFNLVDNAFKHGKPPVSVVLAGQPDGVVLDVVDHGSGLAAAGGDALMSAFARGDSSRQQPGTGLGLAVVQQIVGRLQGRLEHFNDENGHTMRVVLPLHRTPSG